MISVLVYLTPWKQPIHIGIVLALQLSDYTSNVAIALYLTILTLASTNLELEADCTHQLY